MKPYRIIGDANIESALIRVSSSNTCNGAVGESFATTLRSSCN